VTGKFFSQIERGAAAHMRLIFLLVISEADHQICFAVFSGAA